MLVIATNNAHKLEEIRAVVGDRFKIVSLADINCHEDIPETADTLEWLKRYADGKALVSLMSQYTPVPFEESENERAKRRDALLAIENRLVSKAEDRDLRDLIDAYDFEYLFYQELSDDTSWLPDFNRTQPFSNALAKPVWHWKTGFAV